MVVAGVAGAAPAAFAGGWAIAKASLTRGALNDASGFGLRVSSVPTIGCLLLRANFDVRSGNRACCAV
jgi:hypothetical protein